MSKYFETKKGSLEDMVAGVTKGKQSEDYKQLFKKELEKAGKGIGAMSDQEKKDFFNKIDKKYTAKNEDSKKVQKMNVKKSSGEEPKKLKESVKVEGGPPARDDSGKMGPGSGAHNHGKSSSASPKKTSVSKALLNKDGRPSMGKLKNAIDDVNNSRSMAGDNYDITNIDYREKAGRKYLDIEVQEPEKLKKAMQAKYGKSVKFDIEPDTGNAEVYFEELDEKKQYYMYSTKAAAEKKAKEIGGKVEKSTAAHFQGYYAVKEETELEEGAVKDFLMDVEADAGDMSLNDLIRKYYGQMGLTAQDIKKIYYRVNEEKEVKDNPTLQESIMNVWSQGAEEQEQREDEAKWLKTEEKKKITEQPADSRFITCPNCGHKNGLGTKKCTNCGYDLTNVKYKESKHEKKKAMTGSPATKVDVKPEVEYDK